MLLRTGSNGGGACGLVSNRGTKEDSVAMSTFSSNFPGKRCSFAFPNCETDPLTAAVFPLTNYPLPIFCSEADDLHLHVGSADWGQNLL